MDLESNINESVLKELVTTYHLNNDVNMFITIKNTYQDLYADISIFLQKLPQSLEHNNNTQEFVSNILSEDILHIQESNMHETNPEKDLKNFKEDISFTKKLSEDSFKQFSNEQEIALDYMSSIQSLKSTYDKFNLYISQNPNTINIPTSSGILLAYKQLNHVEKIINKILPMYDNIVTQYADIINQLNTLHRSNKIKP